MIKRLLKKYKHQILLIFVFTVFFLLYYYTSSGFTPYNYFTRLAEAFLKGQYWLSEKQGWLSELIPWPGGKYYVIHAPGPAILSIPFVLIWGVNFPQQIIAHIIGALSVITIMIMAWRVRPSYGLTIWAGLLAGAGTIIWFLASAGSSWYLSQVFTFLFLSLAVVESLGKKRPFWVGLALSAVVLSRYNMVLVVPFFAYLLKNELRTKSGFIKAFLGFLPALTIIPWYNYVRFGDIFETGYQYIPGLLQEPWFSKGIFHYSYITTHLRLMFWRLPNFYDHFPYVQPSWEGLAIWITTPAIIYALLAPLKDKIVKVAWLAIVVVALPDLFFGGTGFTQFGYRRAVDFYPFLILLTILGVNRTGLRWHHWLLLVLAIIVNAWGVFWINFFHWVSW